ncbi:MAG: Integral membrane protein TerC, partial [uncultured Solirubrobacteraceae bacterium]
ERRASMDRAHRGSAVVPLAGPALLRARARPRLQRGRALEHRLARRQPLRRRAVARPRLLRTGDRLHDRLPHRALAIARQPLRLPAALLVLRCAAGAAGAAAVLRHRLRARAARPGDPRRRRADRGVPLRHLHPRRDAAAARLPDPQGRRRERRPRQEPHRPRRPAALPGLKRLLRQRVVRQGRPPRAARGVEDLRDAAVPVPGGRRRGGHRLRGRLDPGRLRDHPGRVRDLDGERVRAAGPARVVRPRGGPDPEVPLPRRDDRRRARARRHQAAHRGVGQDRPGAEPAARAGRVRDRHDRLSHRGSPQPARPRRRRSPLELFDVDALELLLVLDDLVVAGVGRGPPGHL